MKEMVWDKTLSVEVEEIDDDHRRLVELFNLLARAVSERESTEVVEARLEELVRCTAWHFSHEERLMLQYDYADREAHAQEHQDLLDSARELQRAIRDADMNLEAEGIEVLEHWLAEHILVADMQLGAYLVGVM